MRPRIVSLSLSPFSPSPSLSSSSSPSPSPSSSSSSSSSLSRTRHPFTHLYLILILCLLSSTSIHAQDKDKSVGECSATSPCTIPGYYCCSYWGYCGSTVLHCGLGCINGCNNKFNTPGNTGGVPVGVNGTTMRPTAIPTVVPTGLRSSTAIATVTGTATGTATRNVTVTTTGTSVNTSTSNTSTSTPTFLSSSVSSVPSNITSSTSTSTNDTLVNIPNTSNITSTSISTSITSTSYISICVVAISMTLMIIWMMIQMIRPIMMPIPGCKSHHTSHIHHIIRHHMMNMIIIGSLIISFACIIVALSLNRFSYDIIHIYDIWSTSTSCHGPTSLQLPCYTHIISQWCTSILSCLAACLHVTTLYLIAKQQITYDPLYIPSIWRIISMTTCILITSTLCWSIGAHMAMLQIANLTMSYIPNLGLSFYMLLVATITSCICCVLYHLRTCHIPSDTIPEISLHQRRGARKDVVSHNTYMDIPDTVSPSHTSRKVGPSDSHKSSHVHVYIPGRSLVQGAIQHEQEMATVDVAVEMQAMMISPLHGITSIEETTTRTATEDRRTSSHPPPVPASWVTERTSTATHDMRADARTSTATHDMRISSTTPINHPSIIPETHDTPTATPRTSIIDTHAHMTPISPISQTRTSETTSPTSPTSRTTLMTTSSPSHDDDITTSRALSVPASPSQIPTSPESTTRSMRVTSHPSPSQIPTSTDSITRSMRVTSHPTPASPHLTYKSSTMKPIDVRSTTTADKMAKFYQSIPSSTSITPVSIGTITPASTSITPVSIGTITPASLPSFKQMYPQREEPVVVSPSLALGAATGISSGLVSVPEEATYSMQQVFGHALDPETERDLETGASAEELLMALPASVSTRITSVTQETMHKKGGYSVG